MTPLNIRWLIRADMPSVLDIEAASFPVPWTEEDFIRILRLRNAIGVVAEIGERVVGYAVYMLHKGSVEIVNMAVRPQSRGQGIGRQLIEHVERRQQARRHSIVMRVSERNLAAQQWLRWLGFRATEIEQGWCSDGQDAYRFERRIQERQHSVEAVR